MTVEELVPDGLWAQIAPLLPAPPPRPRGGRRRVPYRNVLAGMLLLEQNDEWLVGRRYLSESSMALVIAASADHHPASPDHQEVPQLTAS